MEALRNMPIGVQDFESLRSDKYLYVDKTALLYQIVTTGRYYFLSRPRRFGKSMLLSTLHAYFSGKKELFEGLAIEKLEKDWIKYPDSIIVRKSYNGYQFDVPEPHGSQYIDNLAIAKGLAKYAVSAPQFGRIQHICLTDGLSNSNTRHRLDITNSLLLLKGLYANTEDELNSLFRNYAN